MTVGRGTGVTLAQSSGVMVMIPQPVWQFLHEPVAVGHTVVVVGDTAILGQPHSNVTAADGKTKKPVSVRSSTGDIGEPRPRLNPCLGARSKSG